MGDRVMATPIAVVGMACRLPGADDVGRYWGNLLDGVDSISRSEDGPDRPAGYVRAVGRVSGIESFDAEYFRVSPAEATATDPQVRVALELAAVALDNAGYAYGHDRIVGVFAGSGENHYYQQHIVPNAEFRDNYGDERIALVNEKDFLAPRLAFKLGARGPAVTVQASCATGLTAVVLACQALAAGDCDIAVAGAVSLLMPDVDGYARTDGGIPSADGYNRVFDQDASGPVPSAGAGMVVLKRDASAIADRDNRYAVIHGWAINNDGGSRAGFTVPNVEGQENVVRSALRRAGIAPADVGFVEAHGTGTPIGDPIEFEALRRVFGADGRGPGTCLLGSVKSNIGHTDAAAGVAGLIKAALAVRDGVVPPTLHFRTPNPAMDFDTTPFQVNTDVRGWPEPDRPRYAGVSSFGLGGSNAHVVLGAPAGDPQDAPARATQVVTVSARSADDLERARRSLAGHLDGRSLPDVAYTLAVTRRPYAYRWSGVFADAAAAAAALRSPSAPADPVSRWTLAVRGGPDDILPAVRASAGDPLVSRAVQELTRLLGDTEQPPRAAAALGVLGWLRALEVIGLRFARLDGPDWVRPALVWFAAGRPADVLAQVLADCVAGDDLVQPDAGGAAFLIDGGFRFDRAVASMWAGGAPVDWGRYYEGESRRRVPLPGYPFTRRRFWLERLPTAGPDADGATAAGTPADDADVAAVVRGVWREVLGLPADVDDANFLDVGGDSMIAVEIGVRTNEALGLNLPLDLAFQAMTLTDMVNLIQKYRAEGANRDDS